MAIKVALHHKTDYQYDRKVTLSPQVIRLRPAPHARTPIVSYSLKVSPGGHFLNWQQDPFGNWLARVVFPEQVKSFTVEVDLLVEMVAVNPFDFFIEEHAEQFPFDYNEELSSNLAPFLKTSKPTEKLAGWLEKIRADLKSADEPPRTIDFVGQLNQQLCTDIHYTLRMEPGVQTPEETLTKASGSCRDTAWLMVNVLRHLGLAARFVSGYLIQLTSDQKSIDGPSGPEADFTDLHAWTEVYLPGAGWVGLDATSGLFAGEGHIPLTAAPEPSGAAPITGGMTKAETEFKHDMSVKRIDEAARVTKPFTEMQWQAIDLLGQTVDARLKANDVRLTMGGEPTFVSIDNMDAPEWNTEANGRQKFEMSQTLMRRLQQRFAPNGVMQYSQGKWYPGEELPRWAWNISWRADREPLWEDHTLLSNETNAKKVSLAQAETFIAALAQNMNVPVENVVPACEDIRPTAKQLAAGGFKPLENAPVSGFVLPIQWQQAAAAKKAKKDGKGLKKTMAGHWLSEKWKLKDDRLWLIGGDSPVGLRLPLNDLSSMSNLEAPRLLQQDPFAPKPALPSKKELSEQIAANQPLPAAFKDVQVRTAMCIEPTDTGLSVFLPPSHSAEEYAALLNVVEQTAAELEQPIRLDGYSAPPDSRLEILKITPDPGVIEVNVQPAANWQELKNITLGLYEDARQCRLGTDKFMIDGRHSGTGGGNHIVVGGKSPEDSPFLRRPDLLGSIIRYVQNHPAISYVFSGLFIGPTSQAPRVDEGRDEILYELELALGQLPKKGTDCPPWLVDRILRNLLIDLTGNTHRTEICIDKMYSPIGPTGRLGLLEFRGFEMPPHAEMSLLQQLLIRAMIAMFWDKPYQKPLVRWGNALRDRFMLPHFLTEDLYSVLGDLRAEGFDFKPEWFNAQLEFRFSVMGKTTIAGMDIELRNALEPWNVLGEEPGSGGTARYVDSSLERLQIKINNRYGKRYSVLCNGVEMPLQATEMPGEYVAGLRFRGWQPWSCLHPTIPANGPLVFDVYDNDSGQSVGGCRYHIAHPAGLAHEQLPVNALAAETRRLARFEAMGHTPGGMEPILQSPNIDYPHTLDLRQYPSTYR